MINESRMSKLLEAASSMNRRDPGVQAEASIDVTEIVTELLEWGETRHATALAIVALTDEIRNLGTTLVDLFGKDE